MEQKLKLTIFGKKFTFNLTSELYNSSIDETTPGNRVAPAHNLCMRSVDEKDKDELRKILDLPGAAIQIWTKITEEFVPDLNIEVGK